MPQIINAGVNGNNTRDILFRLETDCLSHNPDLVVLMIGTNDMNSRFHVPVHEFENNLQELLQRITETGSAILLINLLPVYEPFLYERHDAEFYQPEGFSARRKTINELILKCAEKFGTGFIDMYHIFRAIGEIGTGGSSWLQNEINSACRDGHHPTADGYRCMAVVIYNYICEHYPSVQKIVCLGDSITNGDGITGGKNYPSYLQKLIN
jgi:lysophospholipase L1-like esterase